MENNSKIKINLLSREIEIEGSENFVNSHLEKINQIFKVFIDSAPEFLSRDYEVQISGSNGGSHNAIVTAETSGRTNNPITKSKKKMVSETDLRKLKNFFKKLPKSIKDVDKIFAIGYFVMENENKPFFNTRDISKYIKTLNINISNTSQAVKYNVRRNKFILLEKGKYNISKEAADKYIERLRKKAKRGFQFIKTLLISVDRYGL